MSRIFEIITPLGTRTFLDTDLPFAIGSSRNAQIVLPKGPETVAWLAESRGYLFLQAEAANAVYHNNELLQGSVWIKSGDTTRIGAFLLHWILAGDRVEVRVEEAVGIDTQLRPPPEKPGDDVPQKTLPRVENSPKATRAGKKLFFPVVLLLVLLAAAFFLLTANRVQIVVQPRPDHLQLSGLPPTIRIGDTFLSVNGHYTVSAQKKGYLPLAEQITVAAGKDHFAFVLEKLPGRVTFISRPVSGAEVLIDGHSLGKTPLRDIELAAGSHGLRAEKKRYLPLKKELIVEGEGKKQNVSLTLQPGWAEVSFASEPAGAMVIQGEITLGKTPLVVEVSAGHRKFRFSKKDYVDRELELDISPGRPLVPEPVRLDPAPAVVHVGSVPNGATVVVGKTLFGTTPVIIKLAPAITHEIHLQLAGYTPVILKRRFKAAARQKISAKLTPRFGTIFLTTDPVAGVLFIDGKKYGPSTGRLRLTTREHSLTVRADGFASESRVVVPNERTSKRLVIRLRKEGADRETGRAIPANNNDAMIRFAPAVVLMGAPRSEPGRRANEQERSVRLPRPCLLAKRLVINGEFRRFQPGHRSGNIGDKTLDGENQPVVNVSWQDAARYCNWLSRKVGLPEFYRSEGTMMVPVRPANTGYRLPSEAEWSFAARMAGRQQRARYPWPGKFPPRTVVGNFGDESAGSLLPVVIRSYNDGFALTAPVGSFPKNSGGFFDMGGNVRQWCQDWYTAYAGLGEQKEAIDSMGPASGTHHVVRGSSWRDATMTSLRLSYRGYSKVAKDDIGFRVARYAK